MSDDPKLTKLKSDATSALTEVEKLAAQLKEAQAKADAAKAALAAAEKAAPAPAAAAPAPPAPKPAAKPSGAPSGDPVTIKMLELAKEQGRSTIFDRAAKMKPCNIGTEGICCKICAQGPCRLPLTKAIKDGTEPDTRMGLCGATPETVVARNLIRMVSAGASAHADHGLELVEALADLGDGAAPDYKIKDEAKLREIAAKLHVLDAPSDVPGLAKAVAEKAFAEFGRQHGELAYLKEAPEDVYSRWTKRGVKPRGVNREAVEILHRTHMGVDQDYENLLLQGVRCALADGWAASSMATDIQDAVFGSPEPRTCEINLGTLAADAVNVVVNGNYPQVAEKLVELAETKELKDYAKAAGAAGGFRITGACSTASELAERHAVPGAADYLQQELAVVTGAVEALVVDSQCAMEALSLLCDCYHTRLVTTSPAARIESGKAEHVPVLPANAGEKAAEILKLAADNFKNRGKTSIPGQKDTILAGYSVASLGKVLKSNGKGPMAPLADALAKGEIRGVVGLLGCNNVRVTPGASGLDPHVEIALELVKNDILVFTTGCTAMALGRAGLLNADAASKAGPALAKFCKQTGLPPVVHLGSCVDNSRLLHVLGGLAKAGPVGSDIRQLPAAVAIPGWTNEQIVSSAFYFAASGVDVFLGFTLPVQGVPSVVRYFEETFAERYGGRLTHEPDPAAQAAKITQLVADKRKALSLK
ncbi:MAG: anaerobic carbon-monoxide dehydrogenase catalytic subunit [Deltaproteobacteria bacterium]|jgi:carbon-monoxide dehydrogenase catalytic subunit|nr:anaerobic carbon-monoxide dehydrogenase catalytic subunit [Deltaproteobacteria bacterium]